MSNNSVTAKAFAKSDGTMAVDPMEWLTTVFVYFLQNLFREFEEGSGMRWSPEQEETEMLVTAEKPTIDALEKTPHIVCVLGAQRWSGLGLDQLQGINYQDGTRTHTDLIPATVTYHCQAKGGLVARRTAWNASYYTNVYRRVIMRCGEVFQVGVNHDIGPESPPSAYTGPLTSTEVVSVQVTVPFFYQPQWRFTPYGVLFRKMKIMITSLIQGIYSAGRSNRINPPSMGGREVTTFSLEQEVRVEE